MSDCDPALGSVPKLAGLRVTFSGALRVGVRGGGVRVWKGCGLRGGGSEALGVWGVPHGSRDVKYPGSVSSDG